MKKGFRFLVLAMLLLGLALPLVPRALADHDIIFGEDFFENHDADDEGESSDVLAERSFYIKVNTSRNRITIYHLKRGKWKAIGTKKCSSGNLDTPTPKGIFTIEKKRPVFNTNGTNWKYVSYFDGKYAIHSTGETDGEFNNKSIGKSVSHGCIRLKPEDARWIYENIPIGTCIEIV